MEEKEKEKTPHNLKNFIDYYKQLKIFDYEQEYETFSQFLLQDLPVCFRLNTVNPNFLKVKRLIEEEYPLFQKIVFFKFPAYKLEISKTDIRKKPELKKYHDFLLSHTTHHTILRQELVSMFPVSLLSPSFSQRVLDMCASPGSKTLQILESLCPSPADSLSSPGVLISCELDSKRSAMLSHKTLFLGFPGYAILNEDATKLPLLNQQGFDRVLCDVPCSGDGTSRKNGLILKNWSYKYGQKLHGLQRELLIHGLKLLKKDGLLVYSTCSLNPIENEAVVSSVLKEHAGKVELLDVVEHFKDCGKEFEAVSRPGLEAWKVLTRIKKKDAWFESFEEVPPEGKGGVQKTMFGKGEEMKKTRRIYHHLGNTGGFYLALFRKVGDITEPEEKKTSILKEYHAKIVENKGNSNENNEEKKVEIEGNKEINETKPQDSNKIKENEEIKINNQEEIAKNDQKKEKQEKTLQMSNFIPIADKNKEVLDNLDVFYGLTKDFPAGQLFGVFTDFDKAEAAFPKRLVLTNKGLLDFYRENPDYAAMKTISFGVNVFKFIREEKLAIKYRVLIESLEQIQPFLKNFRIVTAEKQEFDYLTSLQKNTEFKEIPSLLASKLSALSQGPVIISKAQSSFRLILWRGVNHVNLLMKVQDLQYLAFHEGCL